MSDITKEKEGQLLEEVRKSENFEECLEILKNWDDKKIHTASFYKTVELAETIPNLENLIAYCNNPDEFRAFVVKLFELASTFDDYHKIFINDYSLGEDPEVGDERLAQLAFEKCEKTEEKLLFFIEEFQPSKEVKIIAYKKIIEILNRKA